MPDPQTAARRPAAFADVPDPDPPRHWLWGLCDPGSRSHGGLFTRPWALDWRGRPRVVATDARLFVLLDARGLDAEAAPGPVRERLLGVLDAHDPPAALATTAEALAAWCGPHDPGAAEPCEQCGGSGLCECPRCEGEHNCSVCDGTGEQGPFPPVRPGSLAGVCLDRNRLALALLHLPGPCEVRADPSRRDGADVLVLDGRGWRVLLVGLGRDPDAGPVPEFPAGEGVGP